MVISPVEHEHPSRISGQQDPENDPVGADKWLRFLQALLRYSREGPNLGSAVLGHEAEAVPGDVA